VSLKFPASFPVANLIPNNALSRQGKLMPFSPMQKQLVGLAGWLAVSFAAAALGGFACENAGDFYQQLTRPSWAPPTWLFAPA
jgi:TspO/MBR family protein